jgi:hypothetical protein
LIYYVFGFLFIYFFDVKSRSGIWRQTEL